MTKTERERQTDRGGESYCRAGRTDLPHKTYNTILKVTEIYRERETEIDRGRQAGRDSKSTIQTDLPLQNPKYFSNKRYK